MAFSGDPNVRPGVSLPSRQWITVEVLADRDELQSQETRLQLAWPGRYECRIMPVYGDRAFALVVRHREPAAVTD